MMSNEYTLDYVAVSDFLPKVLICKKAELPQIKELCRRMKPIQKLFMPILKEYLLLEKKIVYNPYELIFVKKTPFNEVVWLGLGSTKSKSGLRHIIANYFDSFGAIGVQGLEEIVKVLERCISIEPVSKAAGGIFIYDLGFTKTIRISVSDCGSIVTSYPESEIRT